MTHQLRGGLRRTRANLGRVGAVRALIAVDEGEHLDEVLPEVLPEEGQDRGLGWHIAYGVLRRRASIDASLAPLLRQDLDRLDAPVRAVLRAGAFEALYGRAKRYAVVDQAVETAKAVGAGRASGLVNAVLRRVEPITLSRADRLEHPAWLVSRWDARYGEEATEAWCLANLEPPPLCLVVRDEATLTELAEEGLELEPATAGGEAVPGVWRAPGGSGRVDELPGFESGQLWVQDAASAWVTDLVPDDAATVLDACAAPGGKTIRLTARGAQVVSVDASRPRLERLLASMERLRLQPDLRIHDWLTGPVEGLGTFDAVLVDAPCTALGTTRRHPEILWRRHEGSPAEMAPIQHGVLSAAAAHVRPGGALVYAVCSPEPEEGEQVIASFLSSHPEFSREATRCSAPPQAGEDAFWGTRLRRA